MRFQDTKPYEDWFWEKNRIELIHDKVLLVNPSKNVLTLEKVGLMEYDELILATGSKSNRFGWKGQDLPGVQGFYSFQDLELLEENSKNIKQAVIVGGGLIGVEVAEMLLTRNIAVTFLVREKGFWDIVLPEEESKMIGREIQDHGVKLLLEKNLKEIQSGANGLVNKVLTEDGLEIDCQMVALTVGVTPNVDFLKNTGIEVDRGVLVDSTHKTNISNIYAIGDCAQFREALPGRRPIEQVWYTGKLQAESLANVLTSDPALYKPGTWFNSAKFFTIEYQVYGDVPNLPPENIQSFYWEDDSGKICFRLNYEKDSQKVTGIHGFGMRLRQDVCIQWIESARLVKDVIANLAESLFDPEFYKKNTKKIQNKFNESLGALNG
ncbi:MAG: FAD-dependent oxidoreductase [Leptospira sp.]|nr:FAD-dependent oxidoreductase [Leptospira sp.]